jgi:hypothetical protein
MSEFQKEILTLFDVNRPGPLTNQELHDIKLYSFPFLINDDNKGRMALLLNKLIDMIEDLKKSEPESLK